MEMAEKRFKAKQPAFTADDKKQAILYITCPISEIDPRIPKKEYGEPIDFDLKMDGIYFMSQVGGDQFLAAQLTYERIRAREAKLVAQMEANEKRVKIVLKELRLIQLRPFTYGKYTRLIEYVGHDENDRALCIRESGGDLWAYYADADGGLTIVSNGIETIEQMRGVKPLSQDNIREMLAHVFIFPGNIPDCSYNALWGGKNACEYKDLDSQS